MKRELNDTELNEVTGGNVTLSESLGIVYFSALNKTCKLKPGVVFREARNLLLDLYDENANMSDAEFDRLVGREFKARGWI